MSDEKVPAEGPQDVNISVTIQAYGKDYKQVWSADVRCEDVMQCVTDSIVDELVKIAVLKAKAAHAACRWVDF